MAQIRDISKRTALYERLSKDDEQQGKSNSILNQKQYLEEYAHKNGFVNIQHFTDDGYTGRNFNRPGFQEMLAEIENGKIGTVIVKDMSRFGRNYLQVGFYTEMMFPQKQVRFIAINNSVDSDKPQEWGCTRWNPTTVREILERQEYLGHTVLRKTIGTNFKTDARRSSTDEEKFVIERIG